MEIGQLIAHYNHRKDNIQQLASDQEVMTRVLNRMGHNQIGCKWIDEQLAVPGMWYNEEWLRDERPNPKVILGNYVEGFGPKIERFKKFNHWFITHNDECIDPQLELESHMIDEGDVNVET